MKDAKNLSIVLGLLDSHWGKLTTNLSEENLTYLDTELRSLENRISSTDDVEMINEAARDFFQIFNQIKPLNYLSVMDENQMRSGSLAGQDDEVRIRILNYCEIIKDKIEGKKPR